jgi:hypothetical protein
MVKSLRIFVSDLWVFIVVGIVSTFVGRHVGASERARGSWESTKRSRLGGVLGCVGRTLTIVQIALVASFVKCQIMAHEFIIFSGIRTR